MGENKEFDVIVVGAGIAGSMCAWLLGKRGFRVLLLEAQSPIKEKICGGGISIGACKFLETSGLLEELPVKTRLQKKGILIKNGDCRIVGWPPPKAEEEGRYGFALRRKELDELLLKKAKEKAMVVEGIVVEKLLFDKGQVVGAKAGDQMGKEHRFFAKCVVGADGVHSTVAKETGNLLLNSKHQCVAIRAYFSGVKGLSNLLEIHFIDRLYPGYFWIFPLPLGEANVGIGMLQADVKGRVADLKKELKNIIESPHLRERFEGAKMVSEIGGAVIPSGSLKNKCYGNGFILVGDAARLVDPLTGSGIFNAMKSAEIAAEVLEEAMQKNNFSEKTLKKYSDRIGREIRTDFFYSHLVQKLIKAKALRDFFMRKASKKQYLTDTLTRAFGEEVGKKSLFSPSFIIRLLF